MNIKLQPYVKVVRKPYSHGAIIRDNFPGFKEDYLAIHSLIRKYQPQRLCEIGTSTGAGTKVICNAMGIKWWQVWKRFSHPSFSMVFSIDVPPGTDPSIIYPQHEDGHPFKAGAYNPLPYVQLFGNSNEFDFSPYYPLDAWFIDGKHNYEFTFNDTKQALKAGPNLLLWHDMQIDEVEQAVLDCMKPHKDYMVYRVEDTRVGYAVRV
jgi:hypothetical protein